MADIPQAVTRHVAPHHPKLRHHFVDMEQQNESSQLAMWLFLLTEIMFFGGLFTGYGIYRFQYAAVWAQAARPLSVFLGGINTAVLITSSLTMAMAVHSAQTGKKNLLILFLILTFLFGAVFLGIKAVEYHDKYTEHLLPGYDFHPEGGENIARGAALFYCFYFAMTGMHALHMIIGVCIIVVLLVMASKNRFSAEYHPHIEYFGLYWHFVDIIWIFLFPLLYLMGRHK